MAASDESDMEDDDPQPPQPPQPPPPPPPPQPPPLGDDGGGAAQAETGCRSKVGGEAPPKMPPGIQPVFDAGQKKRLRERFGINGRFRSRDYDGRSWA
eukprot:COSAG01_NODE_7660_length_3109_cov_10.560797_3_plen_98_part_00